MTDAVFEALSDARDGANDTKDQHAEPSAGGSDTSGPTTNGAHGNESRGSHGESGDGYDESPGQDGAPGRRRRDRHRNRRRTGDDGAGTDAEDAPVATFDVEVEAGTASTGYAIGYLDPETAGAETDRTFAQNVTVDGQLAGETPRNGTPPTNDSPSNETDAAGPGEKTKGRRQKRATDRPDPTDRTTRRIDGPEPVDWRRFQTPRDTDGKLQLGRSTGMRTKS